MTMRLRDLPLCGCFLAAFFLLAGLSGSAAAPAKHPRTGRGRQTHLPVPRFASLEAPICNLRNGPGLRYPIKWVYRREHLPVLIEREFGNWRLLRMPSGTRGWMDGVLLSGRRTFVVIAPHAELRRAPRQHAAAVARLRKGVLGRLRRCRHEDRWCAVSTHGFSGYVRRSDIWGSDYDAQRPAVR